MLLSTLTGFGQTNIYQPFPTDSAAWFTLSTNSSGVNSNDFTEWLGDTIINLTSYKKIFYTHNSSSLLYGGGIRQDIPNEKIYKIDLSNIEHDISISQHLVIGDTFPQLIQGDTMLIISLDSDLIGSKYHKRYNLQGISTYTTAQGTYIVGVGLSTAYGLPGTFSLACFSLHSVNQFGFPPFCQLTTNIENINKEYSISVSPNPFASSTNLIANSADLTVTIYNLCGQPVKQVKTNSQQTVLNRDNLPSGLYFLRVTKGNKTVASDKLVIVDN